jgi:hypothetical protein
MERHLRDWADKWRDTLLIMEVVRARNSILQPFIHEQIDIRFKNIHIDEGKIRTRNQESHIKTKPRKTTIIITYTVFKDTNTH